MGKGLAIAALAAVITAVVAGALLIDSPSTARAHRLDRLRTQDLDRLAAKIDCYWSVEGKLPPDLSDLERKTERLVTRTLAGARCRQPIPADPETGASYRYRALSDATFELCATFLLPSPKDETGVGWYYGSRRRNWKHDAGERCYRLTAAKLNNL